MNPFRSGIVASPWESSDVDVDTIHRDVFERCLQGIDQVRATHRSEGLVIHGEAGSGKTHLLQRLRQRLTPQAPSSTDRYETLYVWVRLQTSPRMIWRALRRTLVNDWFRPIRGSKSQFLRILFHRFAEIRTAEGDLELWYDYMLDNNPAGLKELLDQISVNLDLDRNTSVAFEHIAFGRHIRDLRAWLSGDSLPEAALARLELAQDEGTDEEYEDASKRIVLMLCKLAGDGLPIVISFDQVEALEITPGDHNALFAFGQLTSTLHDNTTNVLCVSCVQTSFFDRLRDQARRADYDRMTSLGAWPLNPLNRDQAAALIKARLNQLNQVDRDRIPAGEVWPLNADDFSRLFAQSGKIPPRQLLSRCAEAYENWLLRAEQPDASLPPESGEMEAQPTTAESITAAPEKKPAATIIEEKWASVVEEKLSTNTPDRTEDIVRHGLPMLVKLTNSTVKTVTDEQLQDVSLIFEQSSGRTGVSLCTQANMTSLAGRLRRLKEQQSKGRLNRLIVIRDSRYPVTPTARKTQQLLDEIEQRQAVILHPAVEILAALDALRDLLSDAKSGNLSWQGDTILPQTVEEWFSQNLTTGLRDFADSILGETTTPSLSASDLQQIEALNSLMASSPVLMMSDATERLGMTLESLKAIVERHPDQFRLLGDGPSATLFRAAE